MELNAKQGSEFVKLARQAIQASFEKKEKESKIKTKAKIKFKEKRGVFVTLHEWLSKKLRGCIGFPYPILPLKEAIIEAAKSAAFSDPRFFPLQEKELSNIIIEISVLSLPQQIKRKDHEILEDIKIGQDGLIVEFLGNSGLLLPQVASEQKWDNLQFIEATCNKAGLPTNAWQNPSCKIFKFQAQIFCEARPKGRIVEVKEE